MTNLPKDLPSPYELAKSGIDPSTGIDQASQLLNQLDDIIRGQQTYGPLADPSLIISTNRLRILLIGRKEGSQELKKTIDDFLGGLDRALPYPSNSVTKLWGTLKETLSYNPKSVTHFLTIYNEIQKQY